MAILGSVKRAVQLVEVIAGEGGPTPTPELIKKCEERFGMSETQVRNAADTLTEVGWLQKMDGTGGVKLFGLGQKLAKLWIIYIECGFRDAEQKHREAEKRMRHLKQMEKLGSGE